MTHQKRERESQRVRKEEEEGTKQTKKQAVKESDSIKMFYSLTLEKELELQPRFFGPSMREVLQQKLISEVSGSEVENRKQEKKRKGASPCFVSRAAAAEKTSTFSLFSFEKKNAV